MAAPEYHRSRPLPGSTRSRAGASNRASALIADAHNDLLLELAFRRGEPNPFARHWLPKLEAGGVALQVCPLYPALEQVPEAALRTTLEQAAAFHRAVAENAERVALVRTRRDLAAVEHGERLGLVLSMEGVEPLGASADLMDVYWELGVRMVGLTWNRRNTFADGLAEERAGGLSQRGRALVERLVTLGVAIDLAHASEPTFWDVLARSGDAPVLVSHAACRAVLDTPRNLSDEQMRAIAARDGVLGVMALPLVVDPAQPTIDRLVDHVEHAVEVMGIDHVALGGDFIRQIVEAGIVEPSPPDTLLPTGTTLREELDGLAGPEEYGNLVRALRDRGAGGDDLEAILWRNLVRVIRSALP
jgi:membrane dipeptidase